jgi:hypothetical protein
MVLILLSSFHFYVVLVYFLWLAGLLMDMQWPRLPFIYNFFSLCFFLPSLDAMSYSMDALETRLQRQQSFFFHYYT